jgi:hypothetical protein
MCPVTLNTHFRSLQLLFTHPIYWVFFGLVGLLALTVGAGSSSHEIMEESHAQLSRVLQTWPDASKMISALDCLAVVTFVGAADLAETELSLKAMWDVIHPKSGSNVCIGLVDF